jgi:hypothetical protein
MARAIRAGRPHLASGELGYHVLDTLSSIDEAVSTGESVPVQRRVTELPLLPDGFDPYERTR